ncbi:hypothetical protein [Streptomyces cyaneofuscatus]|uniref:hypothetical protein n=1 Tax=Streptomyces cyaneofuscatus TaxID=66883 RepID=UPI0037B64C4B
MGPAGELADVSEVPPYSRAALPNGNGRAAVRDRSDVADGELVDRRGVVVHAALHALGCEFERAGCGAAGSLCGASGEGAGGDAAAFEGEGLLVAAERRLLDDRPAAVAPRDRRPDISRPERSRTYPGPNGPGQAAVRTPSSRTVPPVIFGCVVEEQAPRSPSAVNRDVLFLNVTPGSNCAVREPPSQTTLPMSAAAAAGLREARATTAVVAIAAEITGLRM